MRRLAAAAFAGIAVGSCAAPEKPVPPPAAGALHILPEHCDQMIDHYIDLNVAGPEGPMRYWQADRAHESIREKVATDPNMQGLRRECIRTATGRQYACAMRATTVVGWQQCVR